jgi:hypothetical protein
VRQEAKQAPDWRLLIILGAGAAVASVVLMPVQIAIFVIWPPPATAEGMFALLREDPVLGLLSQDVLYALQNTLLALIYLGIGAKLWRGHSAWVTVALALGFIGIAAYFPSNTAVEMLALSGQWAAATGEAQRAGLLAAGEVLIAMSKGTAFLAYYWLNAAALLILAGVMLRSGAFGRATAYAGLLAGVLMLVPSNFGTAGMIFALASLPPWAVFCALVAARLWNRNA